MYFMYFMYYCYCNIVIVILLCSLLSLHIFMSCSYADLADMGRYAFLLSIQAKWKYCNQSQAGIFCVRPIIIQPQSNRVTDRVQFRLETGPVRCIVQDLQKSFQSSWLMGIFMSFQVLLLTECFTTCCAWKFNSRIRVLKSLVCIKIFEFSVN